MNTHDDIITKLTRRVAEFYERAGVEDEASTSEGHDVLISDKQLEGLILSTVKSVELGLMPMIKDDETMENFVHAMTTKMTAHMISYALDTMLCRGEVLPYQALNGIEFVHVDDVDGLVDMLGEE